MRGSIWSLRNKLEDVDRAICLNDPLRGQLAAHELLVRLNHAQAAWQQIAASAPGAASSPSGERLSTLLNESIPSHAESLLEHLRRGEFDFAETFVRMLTDGLYAADGAWDQMADR